MKINIIGTGSDGNCFLFNDSLMIDCGLSFKKIKEHIDIDKVTHILLTHVHGDHFNKTTIRKMFIENNNIIFVCGDFLKEDLIKIGLPPKNITIIENNEIYNFNGFGVASFSLYHDVPNIGYRLAKDKHKHIHATDTVTLEGITAKEYDTATIECNHDRVKALELIEKAKEDEEFSHLAGTINSHLSVQQTVKFCKDNNIKELIPVHIGRSTYDEVMEYLNENNLQ